MARKVLVKQDEKNEIPTEVIASAIVVIAEGMKKIRAGRLNEKAIELLVQHASTTTGYPQRKPSLSEVRSVLNGLESLEKTYLKKKA